MNLLVYATLEEALYLHELLVAEFGGNHGVRDLGLLESALMRPRSGYYETLSLQAAALMQSLALNHSFFDGNKRMSFAMTAVFLQLNGFKLTVAPDPAEQFLIQEIIVKKCDLLVIASWIEKHIKVKSKN